jgi:hypothetical protein
VDRGPDALHRDAGRARGYYVISAKFDFLLPKLRLRVNLKVLKREMKSEENGGCR